MAVELLQQWAESHFPCKISNTLLEQVSLSALPEQCRTLVSQMCHTRSRQCHCCCPPDLSWCLQMCTKVTRVLCSSETKTSKNPMRLGQSQLHSESCLPQRGGGQQRQPEKKQWDDTCSKARKLYRQTGKWPSGQLHDAQFVSTHQAEEQVAVFWQQVALMSSSMCNDS